MVNHGWFACGAICAGGAVAVLIAVVMGGCTCWPGRGTSTIPFPPPVMGPFVKQSQLHFQFDPYFSRQVCIEISYRANAARGVGQSSPNFSTITGITSGELSSFSPGDGVTSLQLPAGATIQARIKSLNVDGVSRTSEPEALRLPLPESTTYPVKMCQNPDGSPRLEWCDRTSGAPDDLRWVIRSPRSAYPDLWQPGDSGQALATWLLGCPETEIMIWRECSPTVAQHMTAQPRLASFGDSITGTVSPDSRTVTLSGWDTNRWRSHTLYVFDLNNLSDACVATVAGALQSVRFTQSPVPQGRAGTFDHRGHYVVAARDNRTGMWSKASNIVDLSIPAAPHDSYVTMLPVEGAQQRIGIQWCDDSDNEDFFQIERGEMSAPDTVGSWVRLGSKPNHAIAEAPEDLIAAEASWRDSYPWYASSGYGLRYRIRAARIVSNMLVYSEWLYTEPLIRRPAVPATTQIRR